MAGGGDGFGSKLWTLWRLNCRHRSAGFAACMQPKQWNWTQMKLNLQLNSMLFEQSHLIWSQKRSSIASYAASWLMEIRITGEESSSLVSIYLAGDKENHLKATH
eukprot:scaffold16_cov176-Skeletonema_marinoi.AAC.8